MSTMTFSRKRSFVGVLSLYRPFLIIYYYYYILCVCNYYYFCVWNFSFLLWEKIISMFFSLTKKWILSRVDFKALYLELPPQDIHIFNPAQPHTYIDCEPSHIGPLCKLLKSRGIWPTRTEDYGHNGNTVVEYRNRALLKGLQARLYTATGSRSCYIDV